jgi:type I restriction enzyme, S subunit
MVALNGLLEVGEEEEILEQDNFDIPDGWIICKFENLFDFKGGNQPPKSDFIDSPQTGYVRLLQIRDFESDRYPVYIKDNSRLPKCESNDLPIARYGASLGRVCSGKEGSYNVALVKILFNKDRLYSDWVKLFLNSSWFQDPLFLVSRSAQNGFNKDEVFSRPVPLPPLNEQRRIVSTIEQLTDRSHKARAALEDLPKLIAQFRQSVLAAAFRGDLTADWREENSDDEWQITILDEIIHGKPRNGYSPKPVDFPTSVKSLTLSSTTSGIFKPEHFKYINEDVSRDSYLWLVPGDILLQRGNTLEYVGTSAIYTGELFEFIYPDLMIKLQIVKEKALPEFIHYQLSSEATRKYFKSHATGTAGNMPKINQKIVMETPIFLPSLKEQLEIMKKIKQMFDGIELLQNICMESKEELNQLDRSILAKAFRGELVPQDPNDEPAGVLLDRIRAEREQTSSNKQRGKTTRKNSSKQLSIDLE